jgi:hypothetical protein
MNELRIPHHCTLLDTYKEKTDWWKNEIDTKGRCALCWLRSYDCFCSVVHMKTSRYSQLFKSIQQQCRIKVEVVIYYHCLEIGRSANTAHIFEALCKEITTSIVYGNTAEEEKFWKELIEENKNHSLSTYTCVLYPDKDSVFLDEWLETMSNIEKQPMNSVFEENEQFNFPVRKLRIILIDGTYPCASRIAGYLRTAQKMFLSTSYAEVSCHASSTTTNRFQFVLLDLDSEENMIHRKSAVAGVMYQPGKDKICSFQAVAIALKDVLNKLGSDGKTDRLVQDLFSSLLFDLHEWIGYIVKKKIKCGKMIEKRKAVPDVDNSLADYIKNIIVRNYCFPSVSFDLLFFF